MFRKAGSRMTCLWFVLVTVCLGRVSPPALASVPFPEAHRECISCHVGSATFDRVNAVSCLSCHEEILQASPGGFFRAGRTFSGHVDGTEEARPAQAPMGGPAYASFGCASCHIYHRTGNQDAGEVDAQPIRTYGLVDLDTGTLECLACHPRALDEQAGFGWRLHPVGITATKLVAQGDPWDLPLADVRATESRDDDVIACTTCHQVHLSANKYLLRWAEDEMVFACGACHEQGNRANPRPTSLARAGSSHGETPGFPRTRLPR